MRILNLDTDKSVDEIGIYLKVDEAKELLGALSQLIEKNDLTHHIHVNDKDYKHEITLVIYDENNYKILNKRSQKLIKENL